MNKRILIVGATGMLGKPVVTNLKESGFIMRLMVRDVEKATAHLGKNFEYIKGDVLNVKSIERAMEDCFGVHINLSGEIEQIGVKNIAAIAAKKNLERITYISGTSVAGENIWVPIIKRKFFAEQYIRDSGVNYTIFCPTWFMEVLPKYIKGNRAIVFGKQPNPYHFIAAKDFARMVALSYNLEEAVNKRFILHGPAGILFHDAVKRYCEFFHPEIEKVTSMPYWFATMIATIKGQKQMKVVSDWMAAFEKIGERGDPSEANRILGSPKTTLNE